MLLFAVLAALTVVPALLVITLRNPVSCAVWLIVSFLGLAGLYLSLTAEFIAFIQILVYAGAIMVLFLFVIMLLNLQRQERATAGRPARTIVAVLLGGVLLLQVGLALFEGGLDAGGAWLAPGRGPYPPEKIAALGNTRVVANHLLTDYVFPFEITSVLILVAIVGAIVLAKREL